MEEERQNQLKLAKKLALELSAWGINPEVGEDNIRDKKVMQMMEVRMMKKEMMLKITIKRTMVRIIEKLH